MFAGLRDRPVPSDLMGGGRGTSPCTELEISSRLCVARASGADPRGARTVDGVTSTLNRAFLRLSRRAEQSDPAKLVETFVDVGPLFTMLSSEDHQIVYGRRGTGKTHALSYLADEVRRRGDLAVYVDMRTIGSTGGVYGDPNLALTERGTRLLLDTITVIHDSLVDRALTMEYESGNATQALALLDRLAEEIASSVRVVGAVQTDEGTSATATTTSVVTAGITAAANPSVQLEASSTNVGERRAERRVQRQGVEMHRVHFGAVSQVLQKVIPALGVERVWILVDEWSSTPLDLQPLLADLIRRSLFPVRGVTVKIGAIEQRSDFRVSMPAGDHLGIEVGADAAADVHLDDFMVFGNDAERAKEFFRNLLYKHVTATLHEEAPDDQPPQSPHQLIQRAFTQYNAFDEYVKAAEGVPRDAINIIAMAATRANDEVIAVPHIRAAARAWYQRDKEAALSDEARTLLVWIMSEVIGERQARAFMLEQGEDRRHPLIQTLYDARVLHLLRRGIAARDRPGVRFNGWGLDYGCYVDLVNTVKAPQGLFQVTAGEDDRASFVEVPSDDYRSIRRAILDLSAFERRPAQLDFSKPSTQ